MRDQYGIDIMKECPYKKKAGHEDKGNLPVSFIVLNGQWHAVNWFLADNARVQDRLLNQDIVFLFAEAKHAIEIF
jgi:hypothetical protein